MIKLKFWAGYSFRWRRYWRKRPIFRLWFIGYEGIRMYIFWKKIRTFPMGEVWKLSWDFCGKVPSILLCFIRIIKNQSHVVKWKVWRVEHPCIEFLFALPWFQFFFKFWYFRFESFFNFWFFFFQFFKFVFFLAIFCPTSWSWILSQIAFFCISCLSVLWENLNFHFSRPSGQFYAHVGIILKDSIRVEATFKIVRWAIKIFRSLNFSGEW